MVTTLLSGSSLTAGEKKQTDSTKDAYIEGLYTLDVQGYIDYAGTANAGVKINMYASLDGVQFDTIPFDTFTLTLSAGNEVRRTYRVDPTGMYIRFEIENPGTVEACGNGGFLVKAVAVSHTPSSV